MLRAAQLVPPAASPVGRPWESDGDALALLRSSHGGACNQPALAVHLHRLPSLPCRPQSFPVAGTSGRHRAGPALSAGGSGKHVEPYGQARGAHERPAAVEAAQHGAVALVSALDLHRFAIAVRACRGLDHLSGIVLHPLGALVAAASMWSHKVKLGGHVNVQPPMKQLNTVLWHS